MNKILGDASSPVADQVWFEEFRKTSKYKNLIGRPVAYFCAEYALDDKLPLFAGGLGVLAGDLIKEAGDQKLPLVAVGLYYHRGYVDETDTEKASKGVSRLGPASFEQVVNSGGKPIIIKVPLYDREVLIKAWEKIIKGTWLILLDTDLDGNTPSDRLITDKLYTNDKETRLKQNIVIGIGGQRFLEAMRVHPSIYHINEGHSAMLALELIYLQMKKRHLNFNDATQFARQHMVFTNHTLVPAGNEVYSNDLVALMLSKYSEALGVPVSELIKLGLVQESSIFSMTMMSLRMSRTISAVSKLHAKKAKEIWADHPMIGITNGIHIKTWDMIKKDSGKAGELWRIHQTRKQALFNFVKEKTGKDWSANHLLLGWARRIVSYKRPLAILDDLPKILEICRNSERPVRLIMSGRPHPGDEKGARMVKEIVSLSEGKLKDVLVYLPGYNIEIAKLLVAGCDAWLNTPIVGFEASGTSGMKAAINGVLPISTRDGWIDEIEMRGKGWLIENENVTADLMKTLEKYVAPLYYNIDSNGIPAQWEENRRNSRRMVLSNFNTTRMLREYIEKLYL